MNSIMPCWQKGVSGENKVDKGNVTSEQIKTRQSFVASFYKL